MLCGGVFCPSQLQWPQLRCISLGGLGFAKELLLSFSKLLCLFDDVNSHALRPGID